MNIKRLRDGLERRIFSIKKSLFNLRMKLSGNYRPRSNPYISADSFRALADHVFDFVDENSKALKVMEKDIVYVNSDDLEKFFQFIHPKIGAKYILISHWGIKPMDEAMAGYLDDKIIHCFAKNTLVRHPKVTPLPIGLEDYHRYNAGIPSEFERLRKNLPNKKNKILFDFKIATNQKERSEAQNFLVGFASAERPAHKLPVFAYHRQLAEYKFVASPPGAGRECHRTWEGIYLRTIPIVKRSVAEEYFQKLGVPIWIIDEWQNIEGVNLPQKYEEIISQANPDILRMDYWIKEILKYKS